MSMPFVTKTEDDGMRIEWHGMSTCLNADKSPGCVGIIDFELDGTVDVIFTKAGERSQVFCFETVDELFELLTSNNLLVGRKVDPKQ